MTFRIGPLCSAPEGASYIGDSLETRAQSQRIVARTVSNSYMSFEQLGLSPKVLEAVTAAGYTTPRRPKEAREDLLEQLEGLVDLGGER